MNGNPGKQIAAHHEVGHAIVFILDGVLLREINIEYDAGMMIDYPWAGEVLPAEGYQGETGIMSLLAGPLAEAKFRANLDFAGRLSFDLADDAQPFLQMQTTAPGSGQVPVVLVSQDGSMREVQTLFLGTIHSDVKQARDIAIDAGRPDVLIPLLRETRRRMNSPRIWYALTTLAGVLFERERVPGAEAAKIVHAAMHHATEVAAYYHWLERGSPLRDDWSDWFAAEAT